MYLFHMKVTFLSSCGLTESFYLSRQIVIWEKLSLCDQLTTLTFAEIIVTESSFGNIDEFFAFKVMFKVYFYFQL